MSFDSLLDHVCALEFCVRFYDEETGEEKYEWYTASDNVKCRLRHRGNAERINGDAQYRHASYVLYLRHIDVDPVKTRVVIEGKRYKVIGAVDMGSEGIYACLYIERDR